MQGDVTEVPRMTFIKRCSFRLRIYRWSLREYFIYDSTVFRNLIGFAGWLAGAALYSCGFARKGFGILAKIHRSAFSEWASRRVEALMRRASQAAKQHECHPLHRVYSDYVQNASPTAHTEKYYDKPERLLGGNAIVLKSPGLKERGVILLYYSYTYKCFAKLFDLDRIMEKYYIVLEPSWSGLCDLDVVQFTLKQQPIFVGTIEPRDKAFIDNLHSNLVPVHFANNTWVDYRVFHPLPGVNKDIDILMVAGWASYKRHWAFFSALSKLPKRGIKPKVALIGYPVGDNSLSILQQAELFAVSDLIEVHEWLSPEEVNRLLNRAKVNVLWSRREGAPRTIIEGMFAGVPCVQRKGFNFGHMYSHINASTGCFSTEADLPDTLLKMIELHSRYSPREWVMEHMTPQRSTVLLNETIKSKALELGENWTRDLVAKTNVLNGQQYWDPEDEKLFAPDYAFLRSAIVR